MATEQQLSDLIYELRDLTQTLRPLSGTSGTTGINSATGSSGMSDRGVDRLITAIGQLAVSLDKSSTNKDIELQKFTAEVNNAADAQEALATQATATAIAIKQAADDQAEAMRKAGLSAEELAKEQQKAQKQKDKDDATSANTKISGDLKNLRFAQSSSAKLWETLGSTGGSAEVLKTKFANLAGASMPAQVALQLFAAGLTGATAATSTFAKGLLKGERGATLAAKSLTDFIMPISKFVDTMGPLLGVLSMLIPGGAIAKGLYFLGTVALSKVASSALEAGAKFNELAAEQVVNLMKSFNELSKAGVGVAGGIDTVMELSQTLGLSNSELEQFNKLLGSNTQTLAMMGGTAAKGAERFASAAGLLVKDFGRELELIGIDRDEQRDMAMSYMNIQARTGRLQMKTAEQVAKETSNYIKELDMLAELTGTSRKQQQETREAALAETRFRAARIDAEQRDDKEQMRRLDIAEKAAAVAKAAGDIKGFTGALQIGAGRGALTTPEAIAAEQTYRITKLFQQPNITDAQIAQQMGESVRLQQRQLAGITAMTGNIDALQTDFVKSADLAQRQLVIAQEAEKAGFKGADAAGEYMKAIQSGRMKPTPEMEKIIDAGRMQQNAAMMMESGIRRFGGAAELSYQASVLFEKAVSMFPGTDIAGGGLKTGTPGTTPSVPTVALPTLEQTKAADTAALNKQQAAIDANEKIKADAKATKEQKEAAQKAEDDANKEAMKAMVAKREAALREQNARKEQRKAENAAKLSGMPTGPAAPVAPAEAMQSYLQKMIGAESRGQNIPNRSGPGGTPTSSAFGIGQMLKGTFEGLASKAKPDNALYGKTFENYKQDVNLQKEALKQYTANSKKLLEDAGIAATDSALYIAHFLGAEGAIRLLKSNESTFLTNAVSADSIAANANVFGKLTTVGDLKKWADTKMGGVPSGLDKVSSAPAVNQTSNKPPLPNAFDVANAGATGTIAQGVTKTETTAPKTPTPSSMASGVQKILTTPTQDPTKHPAYVQSRKEGATPQAAIEAAKAEIAKASSAFKPVTPVTPVGKEGATPQAVSPQAAIEAAIEAAKAEIAKASSTLKPVTPVVPFGSGAPDTSLLNPSTILKAAGFGSGPVPNTINGQPVTTISGRDSVPSPTAPNTPAQPTLPDSTRATAPNTPAQPTLPDSAQLAAPKVSAQPTLPNTNDMVATTNTAGQTSGPSAAEGFSRGMDQQMQVLTAQVGKLDELVALMRTQNTISQSILRTSQA